MMNINKKLEQALFVKIWRWAGWIWIGLVSILTLSATLPVVIIVTNESLNISFYSKEEAKTKNLPINAVSLAHMSAYGLLMWWFAQLKHRNQYLRVAILFLIMGIGLELLQGMIPSRNLSMMDVISNCGGTMFGWGFALVHSQICLSDA